MAEFFEKVKGSFDKSVTAVSARSREVLGGAKIRGQIGAMEEQRKNALEQLGAMVYSLYQKGDNSYEEEAKGNCEEIARLDAEIKAKEEELKQLQIDYRRSMGIPICAFCGEAVDEADNYCRKCGRKVDRT